LSHPKRPPQSSDVALTDEAAVRAD